MGKRGGRKREGCAKAWEGRLLVGQHAAGLSGEEGVVPGTAAEEGGSLISPSLKPTVKTVFVIPEGMENH